MLESIGNHEEPQNFNHYINRFSKSFTQDGDSRMYYSFNVANAHFISLSTELYFYETDKVQAQYDWLLQDLVEANKNRHLRPWIITIGHRPTCMGQLTNYDV